MNNGNHLGNKIVPTGVRNTRLGPNNGANRPIGVIGNASQTQMAAHAIVVPEEEVATPKRQATVALESPSPKVPKYVHEVQPSNGSYLQQGSVEQSRPNSVSRETGQSNQYSINNAPGFNGYHNNGPVPSFVNNPYGYPLSNTNNSYSNAMNNNPYGRGVSNNGYNPGLGNSLPQRSSNFQQLSIRESKNSNQLIYHCIRLTNKCRDEKNWKQCWQEAKKGLALSGARDGQKSQLYLNLGRACNGLKDYEGAKEACQAGLGLPEASDELKSQLYMNFGLACAGLKDYEEAKQACQAGLALPGVSDLGKSHLNHRLAIACTQLKDYEGAKQANAAGLALPRVSDVLEGQLYSNLGFACAELKDYEGAKQACEAGLAIPEASDELKCYLYMNLGFACNGLKDYEGARHACEAGLALPGVSDVVKGQLYDNLGFACNVVKGQLYDNLGFACNELKDYEGAKQACLARLALPGVSEDQKSKIYSNLAKVCNELKDYEGAKEACLAGLAIPGARDQDQSYLYKELCFAFFKLGNNADALKNAAIGLTFSETNIIHKVLFLALLLKCNSENNPSEELQAIAKILKAFMDIDKDSIKAKKVAIKRFSEVISTKEIMKRLNMILESNADPGFERSVWEQIELLVKMEQRISGIT